MSKPFYTSAAIRDLEDILDFIAHDKPGAAVKWVEEIEAKCLMIASAPQIGEAMPQLGPGVRASGILGLQLRAGEPMIVQFKEIDLKRF